MIDLKTIAGDRYRITLDPSAQGEPRSERVWFYRIPCKYGFIGVHGENTLLAYCRSNRLLPRLLAIEGVVMKQRGDREANATFPISQLDAVAAVLQARRRRIVSDAERSRLAEQLRAIRPVKTIAPDAPCDPEG